MDNDFDYGLTWSDQEHDYGIMITALWLERYDYGITITALWLWRHRSHLIRLRLINGIEKQFIS